MLARTRLYAALLADMVSTSDASSSRFVDLRVSLRVADADREGVQTTWRPTTDEVLLEVGGRWDRRKKQYLAAPAPTHMVLRVHRGQEQAARWLAQWFKRKRIGDWRDFARAWSLLLVGGRRSGKSHLAMLSLVLYAVAFPGSVVWAVSPTLETSAELDRVLVATMPREWYTRREVSTGRSIAFRLANGSRIELRSGHKASTLKAGRVDFALLNEGQLVEHRAFINLRGGVVDRGGLVLVAANPPDEPIGRWVEDHYRGIADGAIEGVAFELDPRRNPWIDFASLEAMAAETDERTYQRDVLGLFTPIGDVVMHAWNQLENFRDPPAGLRDITRQVARRELGREADYILGVDLQRSPAIVGAIFVILEDPKVPGIELAWVVDEVWCEPGDENDFLDQIETTPLWKLGGRGDEPECYSSANTAAVMDASAWWQDSEHSAGRTSDRAFTARGWRALFKPQRDSDRNPDILERMKAGNALLKAANGQRRMFVASHCTRIATALRLYENKHGKPNRSSAHAHAVDAVTYVAYRLYGTPKIRGSGGPRYHGHGPIFSERRDITGIGGQEDD